MKMAENKTKTEMVVESKDLDGNNKSVVVIRPDSKKLAEAQKVYNKLFRDGLESGALLRQRLDGYMREQGIWSDEKEKQYNELTTKINENEKRLAGGGIKLSVAKDLAMEMRGDRIAFRNLISERNQMDGNTAEGQSDNARFNYLVSVCILDPDTRKPLFMDIDDYDSQAAEPYIIEAAGELASMMYNLSPDYEKKLPENKFLKRFQFVDEELRLINDDGHLVDGDGRLINDEGRFVAYDEDGVLYFIDRDGDKLDEEGNYITDDDSEPVFLDDDGNPITLEDEAEEEAEAEVEEATEEPKKRGRKPATNKA
jgi:hypothetical protein